MKMILHHLRKDIRAQRWFIFLWLFVLIAMSLQDVLILSPNFDAARFFDKFNMSPVAYLAGFLVWTILIARLIQSEPVTGSTSFWLTRPIRKSVFIPSKLIFLFLFLFLPAFLPILFHAIAYQPSGHMIFSQAEVLLVVQLLAAILVIWLATYTPTLMHFAGMLCLCFVLYVVMILLSVAFHYGLAQRSNPEMIFFYVLFPGLLLSLIVQHWKRETFLGLPLGIGAFVLGLVVQFFAPDRALFNFSNYAPTGRQVQVDFQPDWPDHVLWGIESVGDTERWRQASAPLVPVDSKPETRVWVNDVTATFQPDNDIAEYLGASNRFYGYPPFGQNNEAELLRARFPNISFPNNIPAGNVHVPVYLFSLNPGMDKRLRGTTGKLVLQVAGQVLNFQPVASIPPADPRYIARIPGGFIRVVPRREEVSTQLTLWVFGPSPAPGAAQRYICVLVDPQDGTGKVLTSIGNSSVNSGILIGGEGTSDSMVSYRLNGDESLEHMMLYIFEYAPVADFKTTLVAPHFQMNPTTP